MQDREREPGGREERRRGARRRQVPVGDERAGGVEGGERRDHRDHPQCSQADPRTLCRIMHEHALMRRWYSPGAGEDPGVDTEGSGR